MGDFAPMAALTKQTQLQLQLMLDQHQETGKLLKSRL